MKKINQSLKEAIKDFAVFCLSMIISNLIIQLVFGSDNIWIIFAVASVLSVIFNRLIENIEYKLLDKKSKVK